MIFKLSDLQRIARKQKYAIPHVLGGNLEMTYGAIRAAEALQSPIAIGVAPEVFASIPMEISFPMILNIASRAQVPVAVQLEHGKSYEQIAKAIKLGVNSVMFDGSALPYNENITQTKKIAEMAHAFGVCVEAELGYVGGSALRTPAPGPAGYKTDPDLIPDFIAKTGVDGLAISFGNVHGPYQGKPEIDLALVEKVASLTDVPLVMHGGSGLPDSIYGKIVAAGISNIHFYSAVAMHAWGELKRKIGEDDQYPPYHEVVAHSLKFFEDKTKRLIKLLGSKGKAGDFEKTSS
ncbi:MAG: class II fructose-bisphosphate aldolase [Firmicutes bacterium]|jgi:fructose-bisphosphate aldolase class II|nr:class II fructose-bisphosphate aldolase [Bacillota bacterium]